MAKGKTTVFFCNECGYESAKWMGQCPVCKAWNTFVEETVSVASKGMGGAAKPVYTQTSHSRGRPIQIYALDFDVHIP